MKDDRYQFQSCYVKAYRWLRWMPYAYLVAALYVLWWMVRGCTPFVTFEGGEREWYGRRAILSLIWGISIGTAQSRMRYVYTLDECREHLKAVD